MAKSKGKKALNTGNPQAQIDNIRNQPPFKYRLGETGMNFYDIREMKPVFAFDYLSLNGSRLCFNSQDLTKEDLIGFLDGLKRNSTITYNDLKNNSAYRFHSIDFDKDKISIKRRDFKKALTNKEELLSDDELPTLYQFDLHYHQKARACGFLFKGVFYVVWFDKDHIIYPGGK